MRITIFALLVIAGRLMAQSPTSTPDSTPIPSPSATTSPTPASPPPKSIAATLSREPKGAPTTTFSNETSKIYLNWNGQSLAPGEKIRCIWIAEDVGKAAPANYHVDESATVPNESQASGTFTLSKPKTDWPEGKYRVEIYVGTKLLLTMPFMIEELRGD